MRSDTIAIGHHSVITPPNIQPEKFRQAGIA
jgi:hypothetical protein